MNSIIFLIECCVTRHHQIFTHGAPCPSPVRWRHCNGLMHVSDNIMASVDGWDGLFSTIPKYADKIAP